MKSLLKLLTICHKRVDQRRIRKEEQVAKQLGQDLWMRIVFQERMQRRLENGEKRIHSGSIASGIFLVEGI